MTTIVVTRGHSTYRYSPHIPPLTPRHDTHPDPCAASERQPPSAHHSTRLGEGAPYQRNTGVIRHVTPHRFSLQPFGHRRQQRETAPRREAANRAASRRTEQTMMASDDQYPFYFAVPNWASVESRARVPQHLKATFGAEGRIEHVRNELALRLYRVVGA